MPNISNVFKKLNEELEKIMKDDNFPEPPKSPPNCPQPNYYYPLSPIENAIKSKKCRYCGTLIFINERNCCKCGAPAPIN